MKGDGFHLVRKTGDCILPGTEYYIDTFNATMKKKIAIPDEAVISKIYIVRNHKVMLDIDLAELYLVETGRLNEQVKRNASRFPADFMFKLTTKEWDSLRSQFAMSKRTCLQWSLF